MKERSGEGQMKEWTNEGEERKRKEMGRKGGWKGQEGGGKEGVELYCFHLSVPHLSACCEQQRHSLQRDP